MIVDHDFDYSTLNWVKGEIDQSLEQARLALEEYLENPEDETKLRFCINHIHQVYGTLQVVELYGAALVAEEMEKIAYGLMKNKIDKRNDALEVLMRGTVQLPDYLERLQAGHKDVPIVLLPLLNDLRAASGKKLLSEGVLFVPDLSIVPPKTESSGEDVSKLARKTRHAYQLGLLGWYRDKNTEFSLKQMASVIKQLRSAVIGQVSQQFFWITSGIVEGLQNAGLDASVSVKLLMGQVDRQIKRLVDGGEQELDNEPPEDLVKNLIYYVATVTSTGKLVTELKDAFNLHGLLPSQQELDEARMSLTGRNAELMRSVTDVIREDLNRVKEIIDIFVRSDGQEISELKSIVDILTQNADTLGVIGLGIARNVVQEQVSIVQGIIDGNQDSNEENMMEVAGSLLYVESALDSLVSQPTPIQPQVSDITEASVQDVKNQLPENDYEVLIDVVISETKTDLAKVKAAIISFIDSPWDHIQLDDIPQLLEEINGSIKMMSLNRASEVMDSCRRYISEKLIGEKNVPTDEELAYLADAITSLEYYLEAYQDKRQNQEKILASAEASLAHLGFAISLEGRDPESLQDAFDYVRSLFLQWSAGTRDTEGLSKIITALENSKVFLTEDSVVNEEAVFSAIGEADLILHQAQNGEFGSGDEIVEQFQKKLDLLYQAIDGKSGSIPLRRKEDFEKANGIDGNALTEEDKLISDPAVAKEEYLSEEYIQEGDNLDEEIIEIFIEEAEEQIVTIREMFSIWKQNPEDKESISTVRRAYHTLKGSGRLVGAKELGEFAWAIENMLNRMIDKTIPPSTDINELLEQAITLLPELINNFTTGSTFSSEAQPIINKAWELTGATPPPVVFQAEQKENIPEFKQSAVDMAEAYLSQPAIVLESDNKKVTEVVNLEPMDPVLYEIFSKESTGHIKLFEDYVKSCKQDADNCFVTEELIRALHTLHGSANMAHVISIADLSGELEKYARLLQENNKLPIDEAKTVFEDSLVVFKEIISKIGLGDQPLPSIDNLMDRIDGLISRGNEGETPNRSKVEQTDNELTQQQDGKYDEDLLEIFIEEGGEILKTCGNALKEWPKSLANMEVISSLQRQLHTLKGGARMAEIKPIGDLSHSIEAMLLAVAEEQVQPTDEMIRLVQSAHDEFLVMLEKVKRRQPIDEALDLIEKAKKVIETGTTTFLEDTLGDIDTSPVEESVEEVNPIVETAPVQTEDHVREEFDEDDDGELLEVFMEEGDDILSTCDEMIQNWIESPNDRDVIAEIQRQLHTLKGGARMARIKSIGDLGHIMESMLIAVSEGHVPPSNAMIGLVQSSYDELLSMQDKVKQQQVPDEADDLIAKAQRVIDSGSADFLDEETKAEEESPNEVVQENAKEKSKSGSDMEDALGRLFEDSGDKNPGPEKGIDKFDTDTAIGIPKQVVRSIQEQVRVSAELIDNLVNFGGEVSIYRSRLEQQVNSMKFNLHEMDQTVVRLHDQLRNLDIETEAQMVYRMEEANPDNEEFDPLEFDRFSHMQQLSRSLMESVTDIVSIQRMLENITRESETLLLQQSRVNTDLQEGLMRTRMVPFSSQLPRLRRIVRQTANEVGKSAELKVTGAEGEMDRTMLDRIMPALEHMLRNSIDHGIEAPAVRKKEKKAVAGQIRVSFSREGSDVVLRLTDDGGGINQAAIRKKAIDCGMLNKNTDITEKELLQFILESGFSTAETVTQISGRGVGMDVVNNEIKQLGGSLHIDSKEGEGTTFTIVLPFTLSINRALMINVADETLAIPLLSVEGIARINATDAQQYYQDNAPEYEFAGNKYQFLHMGTLLGIGRPQAAESNRKYPLLLVRTGEHRVALQIDGLMGSREIIVKPVGPQLSAIRGVSGATIMGDGCVVLIIDIHALVRMDIAHHITESEIDEVERQKEEAREPVVMIVDDSITVRKVTERFLKRNNIASIAARDGVEGLAMLQDTIPDVMLLDIEMPRMDGFELATHMRNDDRFKNIPIIMITSRTGDKHRERAMQIGVNDYMGKPYKEDELIERIKFFFDQEVATTH